MYIVLLEFIQLGVTPVVFTRESWEYLCMRKRVGGVLHKIVPSEKGKAIFELKFISFCHRLQWTDH